MPRHPETGLCVTLLPSGLSRTFPPGTILADALFDMGVSVATPCGGKGTCGKCVVRIHGEPGEVLACRTPLTHDTLVHADPGAGPTVTQAAGLSRISRPAAALDIGTTSVKIALVDTHSAMSWETCSFLNPQRRFGHDVISRIAAASDAVARESLTSLIHSAVRMHLNAALNSSGCEAMSLERLAVSGNTTMLYLFLGIDVQPLGRYPFRLAGRDFPDVAPERAGLDAGCSTTVSALPVLSAFIGADLIGGLALCHNMAETARTFFIDLGTNGEIFVVDGTGRIFATSCAMGPALEGMNISWGMTALDGAITHVRETSQGLAYDMLGTGEPAGITGSALVDLLAILLDRGILSASGSITRNPCAIDLPPPIELVFDDGALALNLWGKIRLTQKDIRNIQLAKAASLAASRMLLEAAGMHPGQVRHVYVAGALGQHMDLDHFRRLGFIPDFPHADFSYLGNTSLRAAVEACLDPGFMGSAATLRDRTREVVLAEQRVFQEMFIQAINFPQG